MAQEPQKKPSMLERLMGRVTPPANQQQQNSNQQHQQSNQMTKTNNDANNDANNSQQSNTQQNNQTSNNTNNPLDFLAGMYDNTPNPDSTGAPKFELNPEALTKASSNLDFTKGLDKELLARATSGDSNAMIEVMQSIGREAYKTAMSHNSTLSDKFVNDRLGYESSMLGSHVKSQLTQSELAKIKGAENKTVKQELVRIAEGLSKKFPEATAAEIAEAAQDYLNQLTTATRNPEPEDDSNSDPKAKDVDWDKYLS